VTADWRRYEAELREQQKLGERQFARNLPWLVLGQLLFWTAYYLLRARLGFWGATGVAVALSVGVNLILYGFARRRRRGTNPDADATGAPLSTID
jgi:hypothetical protein